MTRGDDPEPRSQTINLGHNGDRKKRRAMREAAKALAYSERNARHETPEQTEARLEAFKRTPEMLELARIVRSEKR